MLRASQYDTMLQEKADFLRKDLTHLFDDQGIDQSAYDDKVVFEDPITKYSNVQGALIMLATVLPDAASSSEAISYRVCLQYQHASLGICPNLPAA